MDCSISDEGPSNCIIYSVASVDKHFRGKRFGKGRREEGVGVRMLTGWGSVR